ncbi:TIGR00270 family protein [Candidatus Micrarchaeota archaeon RBG_16_36_9]|nr:MAG: TIGR00270 family protein [Candidatus Micrarchaeota archaeon RBG_16_36_9]
MIFIINDKGVNIAECELCGSDKASRKTKIDGAVLTVCNECAGFGEEIKPPAMKIISKKIPKLEEPENLKSDFSEIIRRSREKTGLKQDGLAKKLNEKSSVIKRVEEGWGPSPSLISKLEKFFNIRLTEKPEEKRLEKKTQKEKLTIGDVVEIN